jgi:serine/threonine-protein phosphatase PGAM5
MARKTIYLVRHGQYTFEDSRGEGSLTEVGREQARLTAQRLRSLPIKAIACSTLQRAVETAETIAVELSHASSRRSRSLRECVPCLPSDEAAAFAEITPEEIARGGEQASQAFDRFFTHPRRGDRRELLVCHGNLIRYFVCRVLRIPPEAWMRRRVYGPGLV